MLRIWISYALRLTLAATCLASAIALAQNPFAAPYVDRTQDAARLALDRALTRQATPDWTAAELDQALETNDIDRVTLLLAYADRAALPLPPEIRAKADARVEAENGLIQSSGRCVACFVDPAACRTPARLLACNIPLELTVIGDLKVLGQAALGVERIEELDVTLALVGLGATALVVVTGGSSATVKVGATALRLARRMRALRPGFAADLARMADLPVDSTKFAPYLRGAAKLEDVTDVTKLARISRVAEDLGDVRRQTSTGETLFLLRHVESAEDLTRLARVSKVAGPQTRPMVEILGLARVSRALVRLSDLALTTLALLSALAAQLAGLAAPALMRLLKRLVA